MKHLMYPMLAATVLLASCSAAFKTAETPDDVYYSYGPTAAPREDRIQQEEEGYTSYWQNADDRYLRMKVQNRDRWNTIDDVNYWYGYNNPTSMWNPSWSFNSWNSWNTSPWMLNYGTGWNTWNNPFVFNSYYNSWNNPWCWNRPVIIVNKNPVGAVAQTPRPGFNRGGYNNSVFTRGGNESFNRTGGKPSTQQQAGYGTRELFRTIFSTPSSGGSNSNSGSSWSRPTRTFEPSSSSSGSSSGSSRTSGGGSSSSSSSSSGGSRGGRGGN